MKNKSFSTFFIITLFFSSFLTANDVNQLHVVASNSIVADWIHEVAGDTIKLTTLVQENTDTHNFLPSPQDALAIANADILFEFGLGYEYWLNSLYESSESQAKRIILGHSVKKIQYNHHSCNHQGCTHSHGEYDPHIWLSVDNAIIAVKKIRDVLIRKDPANRIFYEARSEKYLKELKELDSWAFQEINKIPHEKRYLVTNHNTFNYFCKRYNLKNLGNALNSGTTENVDPSASAFVNLIKIIKQYNIPAIFAENIQNPSLMNKIAQEANLPKPKILYTGALSSEDEAANSYIKLMKHNVTTITDSLSK